MHVSTRTRTPNPSVIAASLGNEIVLLNAETGTYFGLDELGALIWSLLSERQDEATIVSRITADYDVDEQRARADVQAFLDKLSAKGLLQEIVR